MAESACVAARDRGLPVAYDAQARRELAQLAKRRGKYAEAAEIWQELLQEGECRSNACEELAIYCERRARDSQKALEFAWMGLKELHKQNSELRYGLARAGEIRRMERLKKRISRLEMRLNAESRKSSAPLLRRAHATGIGK